MITLTGRSCRLKDHARQDSERQDGQKPGF